MHDYDRRETPSQTADLIRTKLLGMFPNQHVKVEAGRGVGIEVAHFSEEEYAREQLRNHYTLPPNLMVKIVIVPGFGSDAWENLNLKPGKNPELKNVGVSPIRKSSNLTPAKATASVIKWFEKNREALSK